MAGYQTRLSGPLLDRIDLAVDVPAVCAADLLLPAGAEASQTVAARVAAARIRQQQRYAALGLEGVGSNAACPAGALDVVVGADAGALALLREAAGTMRLSARSYHRVLKVSRTLADLAGSAATGRAHVAEALSYRARGLAGQRDV